MVEKWSRITISVLMEVLNIGLYLENQKRAKSDTNLLYFFNSTLCGRYSAHIILVSRSTAVLTEMGFFFIFSER